MNELDNFYSKRVQNFLKVLENITLIIAVLAILSLVLEFGFKLSPNTKHYLHRLDIFIILFLIIESIIKLSLATYKGKFIRKYWLEFIIAVFISTLFFGGAFLRLGRIIQLSRAIRITVFVRLFISIKEIFNSFVRFTKTRRWRAVINFFRMNPSRSIVFSFSLVIITGAFLLMFPSSSGQGKHIRFIDALFTSASGVCVTGLTVINIGTDLSIFGQSILLILIQIGGLGLMTFSTFFALLLNQKTEIGHISRMQDILDIDTSSRVKNLVINMIKFTFTIEAIGAIILFISWHKSFPNITSAIYTSVFHSVSAFCNAGFSIFKNNLESFRDNYLLNITFISLIVFGGLGFAVLSNIYNKITHRKEKTIHRLTTHTKIVLLTTAVLLILGTAIIWILEDNNTLKGFNVREKAVASAFQSTTPRTAGFNTIPIKNCLNSTLFFMMFLMFIGASPGSTGGGIKTSTFSIALITLFSSIKNKESIEAFGRSIDKETIYKAFSVIITSFIVVCLSFMSLLIIEKFAFEKLLFEVFSAFGTVGLSTGITPGLSDVGKFIIILTMFAGRTGPLTLVMALSLRKGKGKYTYPKARIMIG